MQRVTIILSGLLAAQVLLAAALHLGSTDPATADGAAGPLVAEFERSNIDALRIEGSDGKTLRVERGGDGWRLPGSAGFPARKKSVERLLSDLAGFDQRLPVARSDASHERFKVAESNFERRVTLLAGGDGRATVLFGSSAGTGRVYARAAGQDMVYEVGFPLWHAALGPTKWHDQSVAQVKPSDVVQARMPGFIVRRADDDQGWRVAASGDAAARAASPGATAKLVRRLAQPGFQQVAKTEPPDGEPTLAYTLTTRDGREIRYRYFTGGGKDKRPMLFRGDQPWAYTVEPKQLAQVRSTKPDTLLASGGSGSGDSSAPSGQKAATGASGGGA